MGGGILSARFWTANKPNIPSCGLAFSEMAASLTRNAVELHNVSNVSAGVAVHQTDSLWRFFLDEI